MALRNIKSLPTNRQLKTVERFDTVLRYDEFEEAAWYKVVGTERMEAPDPELLDRLTLLGSGRIQDRFTRDRETIWFTLLNSGISMRVARNFLYESDPEVSNSDALAIKEILRNAA